MREVVLVDVVRTPFCKMGGALRDKSSAELGIWTLRAMMEKIGIKKEQVNTIFAGSANKDLRAANLGRYITLGGDFPLVTSSTTVEMMEGSGIAAMNHAASKIGLGLDDVAIVGGMDSWSQKPAYMATDVEPYKLIQPTAIQHKLSPYPDEDLDLVTISDRIAGIWKISRNECDEAAAMSRERYEAARKSGLLGEEIAPYTVPATRKTPEIVVTQDDVPDLCRLEECPSLQGGVSTIGNVAHYADGAAFMLMMTAEKAKELGLKPCARWIMGADVGCEPNITGAAAAYAGVKALKLAGLELKDIDLWENNQLSAAYDICARKELSRKLYQTVDPSRWNKNGGALAYGNTVAASGILQAYMAMRELENGGGRYAAISSSCSGGVGVCMIMEKM